MSARFFAALALSLVFTLPMLCADRLFANSLPWWVDEISVSPPGTGGWGSVTLSGTWIDTGAPDSISHTYRDGALHLTVAAPDLNVATGDALTPWTLTEEFVLNDPNINEIFGSIFSVDPFDRGIREHVSGPDFLGWIFPPPQGEFHGLGSTGGSAYVSEAFDVSADGRVVTGHNRLAPGTAGFITSEAFAWTPSTGMISLGHLPGGIPGGSTGRGVSPDGNYVVGDSTTSTQTNHGQEAFRWSLGGGMQGLGTIHGISSTSEARATSHNGNVVVGVDEFFPPILEPGTAPIPGSFRRAFRWDERTGMEDLGTLPDYSNLSTTEASDVSAYGRVITGTAYRGPISDALHFDRAQPFLWTRENGMVGLGNLPRFFPAIIPPPQQETIANAISADGETVVGTDRVKWGPNDDGIYPYQQQSAVLWTREGGWEDLGQFRLPSGPEFLAAEATGVSGEGDYVVGNAFLALTDATVDNSLDGEIDSFGRIRVPFIWDERRGMRPLARVLAGDFGLDLEGWRLINAASISDDGTTIVGTGFNPNGVREAWRAVVHRNVRSGDADFDGDVDLEDAARLLANMGMSSSDEDVYFSSGDFDGDGSVGHNDLSMLLSNYDGRYLGDFNADGVVDAQDYTVLRDHLGDTSGIADSNGDGVATEADLVAWRANFGVALTESSFAAATTVPEPMALVLAMLAITTAVCRRNG